MCELFFMMENKSLTAASLDDGGLQPCLFQLAVQPGQYLTPELLVVQHSQLVIMHVHGRAVHHTAAQVQITHIQASQQATREASDLTWSKGQSSGLGSTAVQTCTYYRHLASAGAAGGLSSD